MKPLTDEQKENVLSDIVKSISYIGKPAPGEFTTQDVINALGDQGNKLSIGKVRYRIGKLVEAEMIGFRKIAKSGSITKVYTPLRDVSYEEILEVLLES